jgi:hypothetical protein
VLLLTSHDTLLQSTLLLQHCECCKPPITTDVAYTTAMCYLCVITAAQTSTLHVVLSHSAPSFTERAHVASTSATSHSKCVMPYTLHSGGHGINTVRY